MAPEAFYSQTGDVDGCADGCEDCEANDNCGDCKGCSAQMDMMDTMPQFGEDG